MTSKLININFNKQTFQPRFRYFQHTQSTKVYSAPTAGAKYWSIDFSGLGCGLGFVTKLQNIFSPGDANFEVITQDYKFLSNLVFKVTRGNTNLQKPQKPNGAGGLGRFRQFVMAPLNLKNLQRWRWRSLGENCQSFPISGMNIQSLEIASRGIKSDRHQIIVHDKFPVGYSERVNTLLLNNLLTGSQIKWLLNSIAEISNLLNCGWEVVA